MWNETCSHGGARPSHQKLTCIAELIQGLIWFKFGLAMFEFPNERNPRNPPCGTARTPKTDPPVFHILSHDVLVRGDENLAVPEYWGTTSKRRGKDLRGVTDFASKPTPKSGLDCPICAEFARQRGGCRPFASLLKRCPRLSLRRVAFHMLCQSLLTGLFAFGKIVIPSSQKLQMAPIAGRSNEGRGCGRGGSRVQG